MGDSPVPCREHAWILHAADLVYLLAGACVPVPGSAVTAPGGGSHPPAAGVVDITARTV